jgi:hypothetical protein
MFPTTRVDLLPPFSTAITPDVVQEAAESFPSDYVIEIVLELSHYLIGLGEKSPLFGAYSYDPFSPSLRTLHDRLHSGHLAPSPLQSHANQAKRAREGLAHRTAKSVTNRPLEDFEDLYYAVISCILDIHQVLNARLGSGFNNLTDLIYPGGPTIATLHESLSQYWGVINTAQYVKAIDEAVRRSRIKHLHQEILLQVQHDEITQADADELLADLYDPNEYSGVQGLVWIGGWAPSMIGAWLEEKYRIVLSVEREAQNPMVESTSRNSRHKKPYQLMVKKPRRDSLYIVSNCLGTDKRAELMPVQANSQPAQPDGMHQICELQAQIDHALEWQMKTQRVEEYSRYLREMASQRARHMVQRTTSRSDSYLGMVSDMGGLVGGEDTEMHFAGF